jgi:hypothetical protein
MSASAKLVCSTEIKDVFEVAAVVEDVISNLVSKYMDKKLKTGAIGPRMKAKHIDKSFDPKSKYLTFDFNLGEEKRSLMVHFDCDKDYEELSDLPKIVCSIGAWGKSDEIILSLCEAFKENIGSVHHRLDDYQSEDFVRYMKKSSRKAGRAS